MSSGETNEDRGKKWLKESCDEGEKREDKQRTIVNGALLKPAGPAEAINTDLTNTHTSQIARGFDKTVFFKHMLSHTLSLCC